MKYFLPEMFCNVSPVAIYDNFGAIQMTAGGFAPPPIHFIDSKWICDSSSNGFVIMALGFLPPSTGKEWEQKVCDDDTTDGDEKPSHDCQVLMQ